MGIAIKTNMTVVVRHAAILLCLPLKSLSRKQVYKGYAKQESMPDHKSCVTIGRIIRQERNIKRTASAAKGTALSRTIFTILPLL